MSVVYALMLYPVWRAREWLPAPWGLVTFMITVAVVGAVVNLRLHLWFTARVYPAQLDAQRRASALWKRLLDTTFAVLLLSVAATIAPTSPSLGRVLHRHGHLQRPERARDGAGHDTGGVSRRLRSVEGFPTTGPAPRQGRTQAGRPRFPPTVAVRPPVTRAEQLSCS